jgi:hypothetical protein
VEFGRLVVRAVQISVYRILRIGAAQVRNLQFIKPEGLFWE